MIQDIGPHQLDISFQERPPRAGDYTLAFHQNKVLLADLPGGLAPPGYEQFRAAYPGLEAELIYLFSIDETGFFLAERDLAETSGFIWKDLQVFRTLPPSWLAFAVLTAGHLAVWRDKNRYCGRCAAPMAPSRVERALVCETCRQIIYPAIAPVVIVGVMDGENLLLTRYAGRNQKTQALVAGFVEIGETFEDAVRREVMEEVGLSVKNIRYYKSQPWAFSQSLLAGFFAEVDGSPEVRVDQKELAEAVWRPRTEIPADAVGYSLTATMIEAFRQGRVRVLPE